MGGSARQEFKSKICLVGRALRSYGLIHHILDQDVEGSNLAATGSHRINFFQFQVPSIFISRKEMESRGRREEMESGNLI